MLDLFGYTFFNHAILSAILGSITCGIIGSYVVTRRLVFIAGGITHASFGGLGLGFFLGFNPLIGAGVFAAITAAAVETISGRKKIREDSAIAMAWSFGMAVGIIFIFLSPGYAPNLMSYLFGSILTVTNGDLWVMFGLAIIVCLVFVLLFNDIKFISFDEEYARSGGAPVKIIKYLLIILVALTCVLYIKVAGIILVLSLLTIPQNMALLFSKKLKNIIILSMVFGLVGSLTGLFLSYYLDIPSGASIIFSLVLLYIITLIINRFKQYGTRKSLKNVKIPSATD